MNDKTIEFIDNFTDWRSVKLRELAEIICETIPDATQEIKWGVPIWSGKSVIVGISGFKKHIKINFLKGVHLNDKEGIFNSGLESKRHRSIDYRERDKINKPAIVNLLKQAKEFDQNG